MLNKSASGDIEGVKKILHAVEYLVDSTTVEGDKEALCL
jgi:hypothetical protein